MSGRQEKSLKFQYVIYALGSIRANKSAVSYKAFKTHMSHASFEEALKLMIEVEADLIPLANSLSKEDRRWILEKVHTLGKTPHGRDNLPGASVTTRKL